MLIPRRGGEGRDDGVTILEMVVAMAVVSVLMAVYVSMVLVMSRATATAGSIATATAQLRAVVDSLGRQAGIASAATAPATVGTDLYLELRSDAVSAGNAPTCTEWRFRSSARQLQVRSWSTLNPVASTWRTVVSDLGNDLATHPPFSVQPVDGLHARPVVTIDLVVSPAHQPTVSLTGAYSLRNYGSAPVGAICAEVARS